MLLVLWERGSVPVRDLGVALQLDYGTLTPLLKRLEAHGLLRRERSAADERSVLITLTDQGAALGSRARAIPAYIGTAMGLDAAEFDQLRTTLRRLTTNVTRAAAQPPPPNCPDPDKVLRVVIPRERRPWRVIISPDAGEVCAVGRLCSASALPHTQAGHDRMG